RKPLENLLQRYSPLEACQCRTEAEMCAHAERQVLTRVAMYVENVSVRRELAMIAARRTDQHHHDAAFANRLPVILDVSVDIACHVGSRRFVSQQLLDCL